MLYRRAMPADYSALVRIAEENARDTLSDTERKSGFITGHFTPEKLAGMNDNLAIVVAEDGGAITGFLCAATRDLPNPAPIVRAMLASYARVSFRGRLLSDWNSFIYGPVCVAAAYRGQGLLKGLFAELKRELRGRFEVGVAFVDRENFHSLRAHVQGLGMSDAGIFKFNSRDYHILAFRCD